MLKYDNQLWSRRKRHEHLSLSQNVGWIFDELLCRGGALICLLWYAHGTSNNFIAIRPRREAAALLSQHLYNRGKLHLHVPFFLLCCLGDTISWVSCPAGWHPLGVWQLCLRWAVRVSLRVSTPVTLLLGRVSVLISARETGKLSPDWRRGGQALDLSKGLIVWWPGASRF